MIEVVYKDEKQHAKGNEGIFQLPRNVRQIGTTDQNYRVYMEDYVYTFLGRAAASGENKEEEERHLAVFMGETKWDAGTCCLFIRGAVLVSGGEISREHVEFTDAMWQQIHEDAEKYFEGEEIVGWFLGGRMQQMEVTEMILRIHLKHFGGEKVLMLMDPVENEEAFFHYENSFMVKQSGFYIYYEKNLQMQNYMIEKNPELSAPQEEEVHDDAAPEGPCSRLEIGSLVFLRERELREEALGLAPQRRCLLVELARMVGTGQFDRRHDERVLVGDGRALQPQT